MPAISSLRCTFEALWILSFYNIEGKITECWLVETEGIFINFPFTEGKITHSWLVERRKYLLLIGRMRNFYILLVSSFSAATTTTSFRFFGIWLFKPDCLCQKYLKIKCYSYKGNTLRWTFVSHKKTAREHLCQKLNTWSDLFGLIIHGRDQVLSSRYGFL